MKNKKIKIKILSKYNKNITSALVVLGPLCACKYTYVYMLICLHKHVCAHVCGQMCCIWPQMFWCLYLYMCVHFCSGECVDITAVCVSVFRYMCTCVNVLWLYICVVVHIVSMLTFGWVHASRHPRATGVCKQVLCTSLWVRQCICMSVFVTVCLHVCASVHWHKCSYAPGLCVSTNAYMGACLCTYGSSS